MKISANVTEISEVNQRCAVVLSVVGEVTATKLFRYVTSYFLFFLVTSNNAFVAFKIAVISNCN